VQDVLLLGRETAIGNNIPREEGYANSVIWHTNWKASTRKSKMGLVKKRKLRAGEWKGSKRRLLAKLARTPAHQVQEFKADAASD